MVHESENLAFDASPLPGEWQAQERRSSVRYPMECDLVGRFCAKRAGNDLVTGTTVNMSSTGVLFRTASTLKPGLCMELDINWPVQSENRTALRMRVFGRVVRVEEGLAVLQISKHEFRAPVHDLN